MKTLPIIASALICMAGTAACLPAAEADNASVIPLEKSNNYGLALRASLGVLNGQADEIVYYDGNKISELNWDLKGIVMGGLSLSWTSGPIQINAGLWSAMNEGNGEMYDYDWLVKGMSEWSDRSISDNIVESGILFDINGSFLAQKYSWCELRLTGGLKYQYWDMRDSDGEYIYSSLSGFRDVVGTFGDVTAIYYEQEYLIPYLGVILGGSASSIAWDTYLTWSPLVIAEDKDHHALRTEVSPDGIHFTEEFFGGTCLGLGCSVAVAVSKSVKLGACLDYQIIPEIIGDTTIQETGDFTEDSAGIGNEWFSAALTVSVDL